MCRAKHQVQAESLKQNMLIASLQYLQLFQCSVFAGKWASQLLSLFSNVCYSCQNDQIHREMFLSVTSLSRVFSVTAHIFSRQILDSLWSPTRIVLELNQAHNEERSDYF